MFRSAQHDRGIGFGVGLCAPGTQNCPLRPTIHSLEFENNFAAAFALARVCDGGFDFV